MEPRPNYPDSGMWAVVARAIFLGGAIAVSAASLAPVKMVPQLLASRHLEHFAAFYLTALAAAAALPRMRLLKLGAGLALFAAVLELARMAPSQHHIWGALDWEADFGGILAALAPAVIGLFRQSFAPRA